MTDESDVSRHYSSGSLLSRIHAGLKELGVAPPIDPDILASVDEFHSGGRDTTIPLIKRLELSAGKCAIDLGCGLGGPARYAARHTGAAVVGVDVTAEFIDAGQALTEMAGLSDRVKHVRASILDLPFSPDIFDAAFMIHVGMNIADKHRIAIEAAKVLKPGAIFGICDMMRQSEDDIAYPVPWAASPRQSSVVTPDRYRFALEDAGFEILSEENMAQIALNFFRDLQKQILSAEGLGPLGLDLVMGEDTSQKVDNMIDNILEMRVAPYRIMARLPE